MPSRPAATTSFLKFLVRVAGSSGRPKGPGEYQPAVFEDGPELHLREFAVNRGIKEGKERRYCPIVMARTALIVTTYEGKKKPLGEGAAIGNRRDQSRQSVAATRPLLRDATT